VLDHYGKVRRLTKTHVAANAEAVTEGDRASQRLIVAALRGRFPTDGVVGEESDSGTSITFDVANPAGRTWVIDPIDGTNNFIAGLGAFAVCIALLEGGYPTLGVVYDVTRNVMYAAAKGHGATVDGRAVRAHQTPLSDSSLLMMTSNLLDKDGNCPGWACRWLAQTAWEVPHPGFGGAGSGAGRRGRRARRGDGQRQAVGQSPPPRRSCWKRAG